RDARAPDVGGRAHFCLYARCELRLLFRQSHDRQDDLPYLRGGLELSGGDSEMQLWLLRGEVMNKHVTWRFVALSQVAVSAAFASASYVVFDNCARLGICDGGALPARVPPPVDAGPEAGPDTGSDTGADAATDGSPEDAPADVVNDVATE